MCGTLTVPDGGLSLVVKFDDKFLVEKSPLATLGGPLRDGVPTAVLFLFLPFSGGGMLSRLL